MTNQMMHRDEKAIHHYIEYVKRTNPSQFKEKLMGYFRGSKNKAHQILARYLLARKITSMKTLFEEHSTKTFLTFFNKLYGDTKRKCVV